MVQKLIVRSFKVWKEEMRGSISFRKREVRESKWNIDREIRILNNKILELKTKKRSIKYIKLDTSFKAYENWVDKNKETAKEENLELVIDDISMRD